jgi:hypothetical protein
LDQLNGPTLSEDFEEMRDVCSTFLYGDTKRRSQFPAIVVSTPFTIVNQITSFITSAIWSIFTCCRRKSGPDDQINSKSDEDTVAVVGAFGIVVASVSIYLIWLWGEVYGMVYGSAALILNQHLFHAMLFRRSFADFVFSIFLGDLFAFTAVGQRKKEKKSTPKDLENGETDDQVESSVKHPVPKEKEKESAPKDLENGVTDDQVESNVKPPVPDQDENAVMDIVEVSTSPARSLPVSPKAALTTVEEREGFGNGDPIVICMSMGVSCSFEEDGDLSAKKEETADKSRGRLHFESYAGPQNNCTTTKYGGHRGKYGDDQSSPNKVIQNQDTSLFQQHIERTIENKCENGPEASGKRMTVIEYGSPKREATGRLTDWDESVSRSLTDSEYIPSVYKELTQKVEAGYSFNEKSISTVGSRERESLSVTESNGTSHHQLVADNFVSINSSSTAPTRSYLESVTSATESTESRLSDEAKVISISPSCAHSARVPPSPHSHQQDYKIHPMESTAIRSENSASTIPDTRDQRVTSSNPGILESLKAIKRKIETDFENAMKLDIGASMTITDPFGSYSETFSYDDTLGEEAEILSRDSFSVGGISALTDDPGIARGRPAIARGRDPNQATNRCHQFVY